LAVFVFAFINLGDHKMLTTTLDNTNEVIDSRDVIARIEELENEQSNLIQQLSDGEITEAEMVAFDKDKGNELDALRELAAEAESSPDWIHGEQLIRASYFVQYITELIDDCYDLPKELTSGDWPYRHITIDFEAAAKEAEQDYNSVDFDGVEYLIRA
jgi:uncharacterized protein (UPF0335 family)